VVVDVERPRDRKALNHDPRFIAIRSQVISYLLGCRFQHDANGTGRGHHPSLFHREPVGSGA